MSVRIKFIILNIFVFAFFMLSIFTSYELYKANYLIELNFYHMKHSHTLYENVVKFQDERLVDHNQFRDDIALISRQSTLCTTSVNAVEAKFMRLIGTVRMLDICQRDVDDSVKSLQALGKYESGEFSKAELVSALYSSVEAYKFNSEEFEPLVRQTVGTLFNFLLTLGFLFGGFVIVLSVYITRGVGKDYNAMRRLSIDFKKMASFPAKNPDPIAEVDRFYNLTYYNPAFTRHFAELPLQGNLKDVLRKESVDFIERAFMEKRSLSVDQKYKGRWYTFLVDYVEFEGLPYVRILGHDVTKKKKIEQDLIEANVELEEFAYRTSHDLRSPILSSLGVLDVIQKRIDQNEIEEACMGINHARSSLTKLKDLIDDIIQLTVTRAKQEEEEEVYLAEIIDDSLEKFSHLEGFDSVTIKRNITTEKLKTKRLRLSMIVENLLSNSIKYQNPENGNPLIELSAWTENENLVFKLQDNGLGIPKDLQKDMFKMFKRFHPKVSYGSGLGLYLMRKSADVINAKIDFTDPGEGVCFTLKIPMEAA